MVFRILLFALFCFLAKGEPCLTNQYIITFGSGTNGQLMTGSALSNCVTGPPGWGWGWGNDISNGMMFVSNGSVPVSSNYSLCCCGAQTPTNTTWLFSSITNLPQVFFSPVGANNFPTMSVGLWFMHTLPDTDNSQNDFIMIKGVGNVDFVNAKLMLYGDDLHKIISMEGCQGNDAFGTNAAFILTGRKYWVTLLYDNQSGHSPVVKLYDSSLNLLNTITQTTPCANGQQNASYVIIGNSDHPHGNASNAFYINNIMVSFGANPTYPLLPSQVTDNIESGTTLNVINLNISGSITHP